MFSTTKNECRDVKIFCCGTSSMERGTKQKKKTRGTVYRVIKSGTIVATYGTTDEAIKAIKVAEYDLDKKEDSHTIQCGHKQKKEN